jgi:hypothetical protein
MSCPSAGKPKPPTNCRGSFLFGFFVHGVLFAELAELFEF